MLCLAQPICDMYSKENTPEMYFQMICWLPFPFFLLDTENRSYSTMGNRLRKMGYRNAFDYGALGTWLDDMFFIWKFVQYTPAIISTCNPHQQVIP